MFVLLIAQLNLMQALAQLVAISLNLQVLRVRLVQLLCEALRQALKYLLDLADAVLDFLHLRSIILGIEIKSIGQVQLVDLGHQLIEKTDEVEHILLEVLEFNSSFLYLIEARDNVLVIVIIGVAHGTCSRRRNVVEGCTVLLLNHVAA